VSRDRATEGESSAVLTLGVRVRVTSAVLAALLLASGLGTTGSERAMSTSTAAPAAFVVPGLPPIALPGDPAPTTTAPPPPTSTTPPEAEQPVLSRTDTGLTRVRLAVDTQAAWVTVTLAGTHIDVSKVVSTSGNTRVTGLGGQQVALWGAGSAVVDLVLAVGSDATPELSMCKNYLGPATATITRTTDAPTVVATLPNAGTDPTVPAGSCENFQQVDVARNELMGPTRWPARADARPLVLANYYPWYDDTTLQRDFGDDPVGPANTVDPASVAAQIDLAKSSGIDGFVVEYEGTPAFDPSIDAVYDTSDRRGDFSVAMMLDFAVLYDHAGWMTSQTIDAALAAMAARSRRASQLRIGTQPVVFVYGASKVDPSMWRAALDRLWASTGISPFVVADDGSLSSAGRYDYSTNELLDQSALLRWASDRRMSLREQPSIGGGSGPLWVAPVSPGYDDRRLNRPRSWFVDRLGGARYDDTWTAALASLPDWILVTSWNEYYEQTHVMPGTSSGDSALGQTSTYAQQFHATG
jgi:hypothetical protein